MTNIYAKRDHQALGEHYLRHIDRMTVEGLHSKSAIAGELAWRDAQVEELQAQLAETRAALKRATSAMRDAEAQKSPAFDPAVQIGNYKAFLDGELEQAKAEMKAEAIKLVPPKYRNRISFITFHPEHGLPGSVGWKYTPKYGES